METIIKINPCNGDYKCLDDVLDSKGKEQIEQLIVEGLAPVRNNVSCRVADTLVESFIYLYENRNNETREIRLITENFVQLYNQTLNIFQESGMHKVLKELLPLFKGQKLSSLVRDLGMEMAIFARAGLDHKTFKVFGEFLDNNLSETIDLVQREKFSMRKLAIPDNCGYLGSHNGNSWDAFAGFLGAAVIVANAVCTIPTAGLAATSIVVGVVAVGNALS